MSESAEAPAVSGGAPAAETTPAISGVEAPAPEPSSPFLESLPADLRSDPSLTKFKDVPSLAKSYVEISGMVGRKGVVLPKEGDEADQARFWNELGRPEAADAYDLSEFMPPEDLPETWKGDALQSVLSRMKDEFHKVGLTNAQANKLTQAWANMQAADYGFAKQMVETQKSETRAALQREYGAKYEATVDLANRAFAQLAGDSTQEISHLLLADGSKLGDHPAFFKLFARAGASLAEHELMGETRSTGVMTPEAAERERSKLTMDKEFMEARFNADHPGHAEAQARWVRLTEMATPNQEQAPIDISG